MLHEHPWSIEIQELNQGGTLSLSYIENSCYRHIAGEPVTEAIDNVCLMALKQNASLWGWLLNAWGFSAHFAQNIDLHSHQFSHGNWG